MRWFAAVWLALGAIVLCDVAQAQADARYSFQTTPGKLPKEVVPLHYALRIEPHAAQERFDGHVEIDIEVSRPVASLTLNGVNLEIGSARLRAADDADTVLAASFDAPQETLALKPASGMIAAGRHRLSIDYSGRIQRYSQGLFQVRYKQREKDGLAEKTMLATHFEPVHARRMFPGWDEPAFRASFDITVVVDAGLTAVSNMPVAGISPRSDGKHEVSFARSLPMPTYLVALYVGEMDLLEDEVDGVRLGIYTARGRTGQAKFALQATREIVHYYNEYFGERYPLPKLDQVALPSILRFAMENWGAILYDEEGLLLDPASAPQRLQQRIYGLIAHEIAHQWTGNLVTMAWWDNLWLNEGFASWLATKASERLRPQWQARLRGSLFLQTAMTDDARRTTHPVRTPVEQDGRALDLFDAITYAKGEAFIDMLEAYLGADDFREGVRRYVRAHRLSNATTADLWHHLSEASGRDVRTFAAQWTEQPGLPVVRISQRCDAERAVVALAQERFTLNDPQAPALHWSVPLSLLEAGGERRAVLLGAAPSEIRFERCAAVLAGHEGYYRAQYDDHGFDALARALPRLDALERMRLLSDTLALVQAGRWDVTRYLRLVERLGAETDRLIWGQAIESLQQLRQLLEAPGDQAAFDRYVVKLLAAPFGSTGWDRRPGESGDAADLRGVLIEALGQAGDAAVLREARRRFAARNAKAIDAAIRPAILNVVGQHADESTFLALLAMMRSATHVDARSEAQSALRRVSEPGLQRRWFDLLLGDELPPGEAVYNLWQSAADSRLAEPAWRFVRANLSAIYAKASPRGRAYVLPGAALQFADPARAEELLQLTRAHLDPGAYYQAEKAADWIRLKAAMKAREARRLMEWIRASLAR